MQGLSTVVLHYDPYAHWQHASESALRIEHYENGAWVVPTGQVVDTVAHTITFQTDSFSPFVLAYRTRAFGDCARGVRHALARGVRPSARGCVRHGEDITGAVNARAF